MEHSHMADWETHNDHQRPMDIKRKIGYFPDEYKKLMQGKLSKRQIEILDGADLKAQEGMIFGQMYADWKDKTNPW